MYSTVKRWIRVMNSSPASSKERGDDGHVSLALAAAVVGEVILCGIIILRIAYTEIDWLAYMQEVKGFLEGERNYYNLRGDTGPLVYPAGFVYAYSVEATGLSETWIHLGERLDLPVGVDYHGRLMYWLTDSGQDIITAQYLFIALYVSLIMFVLSIYRQAASHAMPLWAMFFVCASRRVHSIFVLRLFNDGVAMWLLYAAVYLFILNRWRLGCVSYSLAVGVKMNILLFAPGLLLLLLQANGVVGTAVCLSICAAVQLLLGAPFLLHHPVAYLARSFELGRVFKFKWTVNFKFLSEETFVSPMLSVALLSLTVVTLALFATKWIRSSPPVLIAFDRRVGEIRGVDDANEADSGKTDRQLPSEYIVKTLFISNFIGIVFCRSLHYQVKKFYCWYFHTLPFLLWQTNYPVAVRLAVLMVVEIAFNIFPATSTSSALLQVCHLVLLAGLWTAPVSMKRSSPTKCDKKDQ